MTTREAYPDELAPASVIDSSSSRRRHRGTGPIRPAGRLGRGPLIAMVIHVAVALTLMPVAGHPYDLAALTGTSGAWLRWGVPFFYHWKFGFDLSVLAVGSQALSYALQHLGMSGASALALAWKLPLVLADLLVGATLIDLGRRLRSQRPTLMGTLWLISPVSLWVSAGHGQIESLTILAIVLSLDLLVRGRPLLAGIVTGLGIGVEYLPALTLAVAIFWLYVSVMRRRALAKFIVGCVLAVAFSFGPALSSYLGRTSLLGGLAFTAAVTSNSHHGTSTGPIASSLWAVLNLSPGPAWLVVALTAAALLVAVLARRARQAPSAIDQLRLGTMLAGVLLLCVTLLDPGALPQFAVLVLGGLCLVGLSSDLSPVVIILGPLLQLSAGLLLVYGGSFQSYWYDMWASTGASGWPFPQSSVAADWAARLGAIVVVAGLMIAAPPRLADLRVRLRAVTTRSAVAVGALVLAFLAFWSMQPGFWQGVGPLGPATLADFPLITAAQPGTVSTTVRRTVLAFSPQQIIAARESSIAPTLELSAVAHPYFAQTKAGAARFDRGTVQRLTIPGWARVRTQVRSLWISALVGRPNWNSQTGRINGLPNLVVGRAAPTLHYRTARGREPGARRQRGIVRKWSPPAVRASRISSSAVTWVAPGWAVVTYSVPASLVSRRGRLVLGLRAPRRADGSVSWNGRPHVRWVLVSLHSGTAAAEIDHTRWQIPVTVPSPAPSWWLKHVEQVYLQRIPLTPRQTVSITRLDLGGRRGYIIGGGFAWPSPGALDHTINGIFLLMIGVVDAVVLFAGTLVVRRWVTRRNRPESPIAEATA